MRVEPTAFGGGSRANPLDGPIGLMQQPSREEAARLRREAVREFGAPIFVPSGKWSPLWRLGGVGRSNGEVSSVRVSAQEGYERHLHVTTFTSNRGAAEGLHEQGLVAMVLGGSVPHDVQLPFSTKVEQIQIQVSLEGDDDIELRCLVAPRNWIALGSIANRFVQIHAIGIELDGLVLEKPDLDRILENSF